MKLEHVGRDIYVRHTSTDGDVTVVLHRVWDAERFLDARKDEVARLNADARKSTLPKPALAKVDQITEDQYRKERR